MYASDEIFCIIANKLDCVSISENTQLFITDSFSFGNLSLGNHRAVKATAHNKGRKKGLNFGVAGTKFPKTHELHQGDNLKTLQTGNSV